MLRIKVRFLSFILAAFLISGCFLWNPNIHTVRIASAVTDGELTNLKIDGVSYGDLSFEEVSGYQEIPRKTSHTISFGADDTPIGAIELNGFGTHSWTLTIAGTLSEMTFSLVED